MRKLAAVKLFSLSFLVSGATLWSQSVPQPTPQPTAPVTIASASLPENPEPQTSTTTTDKQRPKRILWLIPAVDVANAKDPFHPLSARQKFNLFADTTFDRVTFITAAFDAGINQATDTPHGYGQGGEGYAKRYGAAVADNVTSNFLGKFLFPVAFRQDPRYFSKRDGTGGQRFGYAISRVFITRGDNGRNQFNASQVLGSFSSAAMVNIWYPPRDRAADTTLIRGATRLGLGMAFNVLKEFWPGISRKMRLAT
jgi:hypothetical protein